MSFLEKLSQKTTYKPITPFESEVDITDYLTAYKNGTMQMGLTTGCTALDKHFVFKKGNLVMINGFDNTGKTILILWLNLISSMLHDWKWIIFSSENKPGSLFRKLMEYYCQKRITEMTDAEFKDAYKFVNDHFKIIKIDKVYTALEIIKIAEEEMIVNKVDGLMVDPYNSMEKDYSLLKRGESAHEYDYKILTRFRVFKEKHNVTVQINTHPVTEALRKTYTLKTKIIDYRGEEHLVEGHPMPPTRADAEGGGKNANRADEFITIHRLAQHHDLWKQTQFHVRKVKESETGGRVTNLDQPIIFEMLAGGVGFNVNGENVIRRILNKENIKDPSNDIFKNMNGEPNF